MEILGLLDVIPFGARRGHGRAGVPCVHEVMRRWRGLVQGDASSTATIIDEFSIETKS